MATTEERREIKDASQVAVEAAEGRLATEQMILNVGPQHPATHGVFRLLATIDGEKLVDADPIIGYMHRGYEKLVEGRDFRQITNLVSRMDWLSGINNELPLWLVVEKMMEIDVPPRAQYLRVLMCEMNRILNHLMFFASFGAELGAITPTFYAFREREDIQAAMEMATGGRMHFGYFRPGGLKEDVPRGFYRQTLKGVRQTIARLDDYENLLVGNEIFKQRTIGVGILEREIAYSYGVSSPIARGSDIDFDVRRGVLRADIEDHLLGGQPAPRRLLHGLRRRAQVRGVRRRLRGARGRHQRPPAAASSGSFAPGHSLM